ncbi:MazG-like family protein [Gottfriedia acidiceleris]|uniref:MazG-like family protein n=1 Tax=Gottfriedia acidiceleris TaxID=371036 RepID=UPI0033948C23
MGKYKNRIIDLMDSVNEEVYQERLRQIEKWGNQRHPIGTWLSILGEEFGEVCQAAQSELGLVSVKDTDADDLYMECIHVAAVASAIAEQIKEQKLKEEA